MTPAQITPGPWKWDGPVWNYDRENEAPWLVAGGSEVLTGEIECKREADAVLIAAAPNLLAALIRCEHAMGDTQAQSCSEYQDAIDQAKAAIERATK